MSENGLLVGYVTMNTRDRDEVSVVEDAEVILQRELRADASLASSGLELCIRGCVSVLRSEGPLVDHKK